ncbi:hypothetical protein T10_8921 [Trichinella papuae]|uniref:Uncharacterized protein n=1 Tax=Trichinella papuae TaxID=268474 RepID=A0A0V1MHB5_9BILA|nr:hypothetical protein T10_6357 [Trichinella papuae]KRZ77495.1 hypothetical protein T10_8921 [Trichinella papuae]
MICTLKRVADSCINLNGSYGVIQTEFHHCPTPSLRNAKRETPNTSTWDIGCGANYPLLMLTEGNG